jgi:hypothetical protein
MIFFDRLSSAAVVNAPRNIVAVSIGASAEYFLSFFHDNLEMKTLMHPYLIALNLFALVSLRQRGHPLHKYSFASSRRLFSNDVTSILDVSSLGSLSSATSKSRRRIAFSLDTLPMGKVFRTHQEGSELERKIGSLLDR